MQKRRIILLINSLSAGGAEKQSLYISSILNNFHDVVLIIFSAKCNNSYYDYIKRKKLKVLFLKGNIIIKSLALLKIIKKLKTEIILSFLYNNNIVASITGLISRTPYIFGGFRGSMGYPTFKTFLLKVLYEYALDGIITNSYAGRQTLIKKGFDHKRLIVIQNAIDIRKKVTIFNKKDSNLFKIISIGRFDILKDYETALKAIEYLLIISPEIINLEYRIIGYGNKIIRSQLERTINEKNLNNNVKIINNPESLDMYYSAADVFISTSIFEGFSNVIMEAMSFKLPVIATNVGDNAYLVENKKTGFILNVKNYKNIAEKLLFLFKNKNYRIKMGQKGFEKINNEYSIKSMEIKYLRLINTLPSI